ncbi:MAG: DEAD/DEAH box helicase [Candidatus Eremiobacteraeota bacterium]|nr:DEAD/DEAH box helicase [Candidatus Eremiobacteraeota bacterium]
MWRAKTSSPRAGSAAQRPRPRAAWHRPRRSAIARSATRARSPSRSRTPARRRRRSIHSTRRTPDCTTPPWSKATRKSRSTSKRSRPQLPSKPRTRALPAPTPSELAFEAALHALRQAQGQLASEIRDGADEFVERVFAQSDGYLHDPYATIGDAPRFHTKIAGVSFEGRQDVIAGLRAGAELELRREPRNPHDPNAIAVAYGNLQLGFFNRRIAAHLAPLIDAGARYRAHIASLTGGADPSTGSGQAKHRGVNIFVERESAGPSTPLRHAQRRSGRAPLHRESQVAESVRAALLGSARPHAAQLAVLERLDAGKNTLALLGTGRGKSFCFQFAAALRALGRSQDGDGKTLVVYPLRALANDQYEALRRTLDPLGLRCFRANGSIDNEEREDLFRALREGAWDVVLATPEFLEFHRDALRGGGTPSFVVVDEAHHLHESRHRPAYARLAATIASFGAVQILALTATARDDAFRRIVDDLKIDAWVIDPTVRENLAVVDARNTKDKIGYLTELFGADGGHSKGILYCNSRPEVAKVAQRLRATLGNRVVFYHGRMPNSDRLQVERLFREGQLRVVVATSAFGEGIDLPDVRNVVLYHLNFDFGEFNQQAGRAGRDGAPARIHLLYGEQDRALNDYLIDIDAPPLARLREIYRGLRRQTLVRGDNAQLASILDLERVADRTIGAALRIFADSQLIEVGEDDEGRFVRFLPVTGKVQMERNERYAEGEATREAFAQFSDLALNAPATTLERIINRPIYPSRVELLR